MVPGCPTSGDFLEMFTQFFCKILLVTKERLSLLFEQLTLVCQPTLAFLLAELLKFRRLWKENRKSYLVILFHIWTLWR